MADARQQMLEERHLTMDSGAAFELGVNKRFAILTIVGSLLLTALIWAYLLGALA